MERGLSRWSNKAGARVFKNTFQRSQKQSSSCSRESQKGVESCSPKASGKSSWSGTKEFRKSDGVSQHHSISLKFQVEILFLVVDSMLCRQREGFLLSRERRFVVKYSIALMLPVFQS